MSSHIVDPHNPHHPDYQLGLEAGQWLVQLIETRPAPDSPSVGDDNRSAAFLEWVSRSPRHLTMFLDTYEVYRRLEHIDPEKRIQIEELLESRTAEVIQLFGPVPEERRPNRRRQVLVGLAASLAVVMIGCFFAWKLLGVEEFSTAIGEQRTCKLEDGSFVYLNTDSRIKVEFTKGERRVELTRGEALFAVERDVKRPFIVVASGTNIRAVGTQFNVRRRANSTDVAVVEGIVQVSTAATSSGSPNQTPNKENATVEPVTQPKSPDSDRGTGSNRLTTTSLSSGEQLSVSGGHLRKQPHPNVMDAVSWRQRRLVFQDTPLSEVAAEFNRYNTRQIRVEGITPMELTGAFDADRPSALILYAQKQNSLVVEPDGDNWVIRAR